MDQKAVLAIFTGSVIYVLVIVLRSIQRDLTGHQLVLMLVAPFLTGFFSGGVKKGFLFSFIISFTMLLVEMIVIMQGVLTDPNIAFAVILMSLPIVAISTVVGIVGGFIGKRLYP